MYDNEYPNGTGTPGQEEESDRPGKYYPIYDAVNDLSIICKRNGGGLE